MSIEKAYGYRIQCDELVPVNVSYKTQCDSVNIHLVNRHTSAFGGKEVVDQMLKIGWGYDQATEKWICRKCLAEAKANKKPEFYKPNPHCQN